MSIYRQDFVVCPSCNGKSGQRVDHLYDQPCPRAFGPWRCSACKNEFTGSVIAPGEIKTSPYKGRGTTVRAMNLLRLDSADGPVFFVMDHDRYFEPPTTEEEKESSQCYFFEEHSCPTNWLRECVAVIVGDDCDPHGFLTFVRSVEVPDDFNADDDANWPRLFPECFQIIDGAANESGRCLTDGTQVSNFAKNTGAP